MSQLENELHAALKRAPQATRAKLHSADGAIREAALPGGRNRAAAGAQLVARLGFVRCELLDKNGAVVDEVVGETPTASPSISAVADMPGEDRRLLALLEVVMAAQDRALARRESEFRAVLSGVTDVMKAQATAMQNLAAVYQEAGDVRAHAAEQGALAEASNGGLLAQVAELAPHLPTLLGAAKALGGGGAS